ncbi:hypothetical protein L6452_03670 [Arctium lappa]|uniref:Uncharacterized protein n=1 Tax=Arctium lappa TaxID=4217 RepID=A0ACB9FMI0_ARCLA|nr:hypothetical protein L6452_03670 [Arctium lappa]
MHAREMKWSCLFLSNAGDSRAVIGSVITRGQSDIIVADQINHDETTLREEVRQELKFDQRDDPQGIARRLLKAAMKVAARKANRSTEFHSVPA